jgi:hypothetical protein
MLEIKKGKAKVAGTSEKGCPSASPGPDLRRGEVDDPSAVTRLPELAKERKMEIRTVHHDNGIRFLFFDPAAESSFQSNQTGNR